MKVLVCGDRNWTGVATMRTRLDALSMVCGPITLLHGGCRGADQMAGGVGFKIGWNIHVYPAQWDKYGRAAGPIRNQTMLSEKPDLVLAFHNDIDNSKGTKDMVRRAREAGITTEVIREHEGT